MIRPGAVRCRGERCVYEQKGEERGKAVECLHDRPEKIYPGIHRGTTGVQDASGDHCRSQSFPRRLTGRVRQVSWLMALLHAAPSRPDDHRTVAVAQIAIYSCGAASGFNGIPFSSRPGAGHRTNFNNQLSTDNRHPNIVGGTGKVKNIPCRTPFNFRTEHPGWSSPSG